MKRVGAIVLALLMVTTIFSSCTSKEKQAAINVYNEAYDSAEAKNAELDTIIADAEVLIKQSEPAYDETALPALETAVSEAKAAKVKLPEEMPNKLEEINSIVSNTLNKVDYTEVLKNISNAKSTYEASIKQMRQITCPDETFIIERLNKVDGITGVSAVTEDNDPNNQLGKQGGYTAQIFFSHEYINQSEIEGNSIIDKGTDCGGSIEVYKTAEEANNRNDYLGSFDGTMFASGSHTVYGTIIVRTSSELKASQQKEIEQSVIDSLLNVEE